MARSSAAALTLAILPMAGNLQGCGAPAEEAVVVRDSAGVTIVHSNVPAWVPGEGWHIAAAPSLSFGGLVGQRPYEFTTVGDVRRLADGRLLVTHCSNPPELRLYESNGAFIRSLGGAGTGPGQCSFILRSWLAPPDTALLYDPSLARLTYFQLGGAGVRTVELDLSGFGPDEAAAPVWLDRFEDGTLLGRPNSAPPVTDGRARAPMTYLRLDPADLTVDTVLTVPGAEYVTERLGTDEEDVRPVLFGPFTSAVARGMNVYMADSDAFTIEERAVDGTLLRRFARRWDPVGIDGRFRRQYREQRMAAADPAERSTVRRELAHAVFADHFPALEGSLIVDPEGHLWALQVRTPGDTARVWTVFDPDGRWLGDVVVPTELRVTDVGEDYVLGVWRDADGVQTIRSFELVKPTPATRSTAPADG